MTVSYRCTRCSYRPTDEEDQQNLSCCPRCKTTSVPMRDDNDVTVEVNWHELRILGIWAENWAAFHKEKDGGDGQRLVSIICGRIHAQHPEKLGLTMSAELADLRREFKDVEVTGFQEDQEANRDVEPPSAFQVMEANLGAKCNCASHGLVEAWRHGDQCPFGTAAERGSDAC